MRKHVAVALAVALASLPLAVSAPCASYASEFGTDEYTEQYIGDVLGVNDNGTEGDEVSDKDMGLRYNGDENKLGWDENILQNQLPEGEKFENPLAGSVGSAMANVLQYGMLIAFALIVIREIAFASACAMGRGKEMAELLSGAHIAPDFTGNNGNNRNTGNNRNNESGDPFYYFKEDAKRLARGLMWFVLVWSVLRVLAALLILIASGFSMPIGDAFFGTGNGIRGYQEVVLGQ